MDVPVVPGFGAVLHSALHDEEVSEGLVALDVSHGIAGQPGPEQLLLTSAWDRRALTPNRPTTCGAA
jgi:hypothetical protein